MFWTLSFSMNSQLTLEFKKLGPSKFVLVNINILKSNALCSAQCFLTYHSFIQQIQDTVRKGNLLTYSLPLWSLKFRIGVTEAFNLFVTHRLVK